jgi:hypothetical protein
MHLFHTVLLNSPPVILFLFISFFVLIIFLAFLFSRKNTERSWSNLAMIGDQFGITVERPEIGLFRRPLPFMTGSYKNYRLSLHTEIRGSGKHRQAYTILNISVPAAYADLEVYREGFFSKIGKAFGMQDIQTGNADFDKRFMLRSKDENFALDLFDMNLCGKLIDAIPYLSSGIYIKNKNMSYAEAGSLSSNRLRDRFIQVIPLCMEIISRIEQVKNKTGSRTGAFRP